MADQLDELDVDVGAVLGSETETQNRVSLYTHCNQTNAARAICLQLGFALPL